MTLFLLILEALPTYAKGHLLFPDPAEHGGGLEFARAAVNCAHTVEGVKRKGIPLLGRAGKLIGFFDTGRYMPSHVGFDSKRDFWLATRCGVPRGFVEEIAVSGGWIGALADSGRVAAHDWWIQFREDGSELTISDLGRRLRLGWRTRARAVRRGGGAVEVRRIPRPDGSTGKAGTSA